MTQEVLSEKNPAPLARTLNEVFGFSEFRALQETAVKAAVAGEDLLVVMPTGAGKSLCYQLPAAVATGVTLVVSPLVALMRDQVAALHERTTFSHLGAAFLNSSQTFEEQSQILHLLRAGELKLLYVAPERFRSSGFIAALQQVELARFVVDEAHCISQWGHDFRPDYLSLKTAVETLGSPPLTAVTATATKRVQSSIIENLGMKEPRVLVGGFDRPNLHFSVVRCASDQDRADKLARALPKLARRGGSGLVYVATRKQCEEVASLAGRALAPLGVRVAPYHAGMESEARSAVQSGWLSGEIHLLIATNAFGMGVDKPDVRYVIHWAYPESPESYYQEAGRAGRDGQKSRCVILYHFSDRRLREFFIDNDEITVSMITGALAAIHTRIQPSQSATGEYAIEFNAPDFNGEQFNGQGFNGAVEKTPTEDESALAVIPRFWWQQALGWKEVFARSVLGKLEYFGLIERLTENAEHTTIKVLRKEVSPALSASIERHLENERGERHARLREMIDYCRAASCRRRVLLEYFGDEHEATPRGYCCDVCDSPEKFQKKASPLPENLSVSGTSGADIHSILQNIDVMRPRVGKVKLEKLLRGSKSRDLERYGAGHPLRGVLRGCKSERVVKFLDDLIAEGLLAQADEEEYFVCYTTEAGRAAWQNKSEIGVASPLNYTAASVSRALDYNEPGAELFEELRSWRRRRADEEGIPAYLVFSDKTLRAIAATRPSDQDALAEISGIGRKKLEKYSEEVLSITNR